LRQLIAALSLIGAVVIGLLILAGPGGDASQALGPDDPDTLRWAQDLLYRSGYYEGDFSEQLDPATTAAIERFQKDHLLDINGLLDPATLAALDQVEQEFRAAGGLLDDIG